MFYQHLMISAPRAIVKSASKASALSILLLVASSVPAPCQDYDAARSIILVYHLKQPNGPSCKYSSGMVFTTCKAAEAHFEKKGVEVALSLATPYCRAIFFGMNAYMTFTKLNNGCGENISRDSRTTIQRNGRKYLQLHYRDQVE